MNNVVYRLRALAHRNLAMTALARNKWEEYDQLCQMALSDYDKLQAFGAVNTDLLKLEHAGAIFMCYQYKNFDELSIQYEKIIKICESVNEDCMKPPAELLIGRVLLSVKQLKNGRDILTTILSQSGDVVQGQAFR